MRSFSVHEWGPAPTLTRFDRVLLAEFEIWHSRPIAPTRRVALGQMMLPVDPAPGLGGVLLGAVVASNIGAVDEDLVVDIHRLVNEVDRGERIRQPRLRHRFQVDRHGLAHSVHRLLAEGDSFTFDIAPSGAPLPQVLGAIYVLERFDEVTRRLLVPVIRRALMWRGPMDASFVSHLAGSGGGSLQSVADPRAWALDVLGFPGGTLRYTKVEVMTKYRQRMRQAHPDHGGDQIAASRQMGEISEARRVLLDAL